MNRTVFWRWFFYCVGMLLLSLGIAMTIKANRLGIAPWDVLHVGLYSQFGFTIGTWAIIIGVILILIIWILTKKMIPLATWLNIVIIGACIDFFNFVLPDFPTLTSQIIVFLFGLIVMSYGIGFYVAPNIGAGPRDTLMLIIDEKTGWGVRKVRTILEISAALLGWMLGGPIGIGTVLIALLLGQFVHYTISQCRMLLAKCTCGFGKSLKIE